MALDDPIPLAYTLCFLTHGSQVLMLHRRYPPNQGLWNGVGGRIEPGETPLACILREVQEETGYHLESVRFGGIVTWLGFEPSTGIETQPGQTPPGGPPPGGLYLYQAEAPAGEPAQSNEGELAWRPLEWVLSSRAVVSNIPIFIPHLLEDHPPQEYAFNYQNGAIHSYAFNPLPNWVM